MPCSQTQPERRLAASVFLHDSDFYGVIDSLEVGEQRIFVLFVDVGNNVADEFICPEVLRKDVHVVLSEDAIDL